MPLMLVHRDRDQNAIRMLTESLGLAIASAWKGDEKTGYDIPEI